MGISVKKSTVMMDGREKVTDAVLMKSKVKSIVSPYVPSMQCSVPKIVNR